MFLQNREHFLLGFELTQKTDFWIAIKDGAQSNARALIRIYDDGWDRHNTRCVLRVVKTHQTASHTLFADNRQLTVSLSLCL
jgi:hypothetical protein